MDVKTQAEQLREALNEHNYHYYVLDAPTISDFEYDIVRPVSAAEGQARCGPEKEGKPIRHPQ